VEARFYEDIQLPEPVLDLGCGDGHFASLTFDKSLDIGLDPWWSQIQEAEERKSHQHLVCATGDQIPFPENYFSSAISNSVLEHIPDLDSTLQELSRVLKPGAPFVFCVPNHRFLGELSLSKTLNKIQLKNLAKTYQRLFNRISRHFHCDSRQTWKSRLAAFGFEILNSWDYFPPSSLQILEWGHLGGVPAWFCKMLFNKWILVPYKWNLFFTDLLVRPAYQGNPLSEVGVYSFYITRWKS
jgi:SAM-dependent methyltransferase